MKKYLLVLMAGLFVMSCSIAELGIDGVDGIDGIQGEQGIAGKDGADGMDAAIPSFEVISKGTDCTSVIFYLNNIEVNNFTICDGEDGASAYQVALDNEFEGDIGQWLNSLVGEKGIDTTPSDVITFIRACAQSDERIMKVVKPNGDVEFYAVYYDKVDKYAYWAQLQEGLTYRTTDGTDCIFTLADLQ